MTDDLVLHRERLGRLEPLGRGGTAVVYDLPDLRPAALGAPELDGLVYKEYTPAIRRMAGPSLLLGLRNLVSFRNDHLAESQRRHWDQRIVWPLRVVTDDDGAATGAVMPLIPARFFQRIVRVSGGAVSRPRDLELLFGARADLRRVGVGWADEATRLALVDEIAIGYAMMHRADIVVGDISGRNLVYDPTLAHPAVLVVDTDSTRREGTRATFNTQPHTPHWEPPEVLAALRRYRSDRRAAGDGHLSPPAALTAQSRRMDVYKFALMVARILDPGRGTAVTRDPAGALRVLRAARGAAAAAVLEAMLSDDPRARPPLRTWCELTRRDRTAPQAPPEPPHAPAAPEPPSAPATSAAPPAAGGAVASAPEGGQVRGRWMFVDGVGWERRR